ncbi:TnsD family Tn7-like transposition protein [Solimonas sp. SE-A11]|uniref:TnsD family Tn7-like transposition protein n=1 Tax=Solimonas sp. SE-A11 TaxID=3054954 RepID=UPI00259D00D9|nr:TnsD family Tn7-like transposition protein [Solimonas sp. SE-A11]MDM4772857.1 TnsD family Tn7-like transposition protein [Solimonas sp. SE-A11]
MRKALIEQGLRRGGHLCYHALNQALARRYGGSLQKWLFDARGLSAAGFNWPRNVLNEPQYAKHPLLKVLLTLLVSDSIGAFESTALDSPIGQSSETAHQDRWAPEWVHALRLKADHGESAAAIARSLQVPLPEVRFFAARLGVIFLRKEPSAVLLKRSVDRVLAGASLNRERLRIKVSTDRLLNEVAKVDIEFAEQIRQKLHGDTQARYRALLETAVAELDSLTQIQGKHGTAFNWLGSHDREWLKEVTAPLRCRRAQNPPRNLPRTDDVQSAERVLLAAAEMQRLSDYPRITSTNLFDAAGLRSMVRKSPSRFPLTHEAILANVESTADFGRRQLTLVVAELAKSSRVIRRSAVLQRYQIPACLKASRDQIIREIVEAAGLQFVDE